MSERTILEIDRGDFQIVMWEHTDGTIGIGMMNDVMVFEQVNLLPEELDKIIEAWETH